jgi:MFS family permease
MSAISKTLKTQLNTDNITTIMVGISLTLAFVALPAGFLATKIGNRQAMLAGIGTTILSIILLLGLGAHFLIILLALVGFSLISNGVIPFILGLMTQRWAGLGIGMYFGEFSLAMSLFSFVFPATITSLVAGFGSALAFLITGVCIMISGKYSKPQLS